MNCPKPIIHSVTIKVLVLFSSIFIQSHLFADSATLEGTTLVVPHIKVSSSVYSVTFEKTSDSLPASFNFVGSTETSYVEGTSGALASYSSIRNELDIPSVVIDGKNYHMTLIGGSTPNSYVIKSFGLNVPDFLFMINAGDVSYANSGVYGGQEFAKHFSMDVTSSAQAFSDRPFRLASELKGGLQGFVNIYAGSDFSNDSPNTTFAGTYAAGNLAASIFELGQPVAIGDKVIFPVTRFIGTEPVLQEGNYTGSNFVVDNFWDVLGDVVSVIGTVALCTGGEVASAGTDTVACGLAVAGTAADLAN